MPQFSIRSLRIKILIIPLSFIAFLSTAFVLYSIVTTANYKRLRLYVIEQSVAYEAEKVNKAIAMVEQGAMSLARDGLLFFTSQGNIIGESSVLEYLSSYPRVAGGGFLFEPYAFNNTLLHAGVYAYVNRTGTEAHTYEFGFADYHSYDWYRDIISSVQQPYQAAWTVPYVDDLTSRLMSTVGAGIFDAAGRLIGISFINTEIEQVVEELSSIKPTENSLVLFNAPRLDIFITNTHAEIDEADSTKSIPWEPNENEFILDGVRYLSVSRYTDNGWLISVQIPENEIFAEIDRQNNRFLMIIGFSSVIMLSFAYVLISKLINTPLQRLISKVSQVALGNMEIHIDISTKDELGLLERTFNKITADLHKSIEAYTKEHVEKERLATELAIAENIQTHMLPYIFPPFPDRTEFDLYASMFPAKEVGGDLYDFYLRDKDTLVVLVADVSGRGVPAAVFTIITKTLIKDNVYSGKSPKEVFETVNNALCINNNTGMFVTAFMGYYNIKNKSFVYVNAGHNPPLLKKSGKNYEYLNIKPCLVLASMDDIVYTEDEIKLESGDTLFLYTDGVPEAMNVDREQFSEERMLDVINKNSGLLPKELIYEIMMETGNFIGGAEQADDITMLALRIDQYNLQTEPMMKELKVEAKASRLHDVIGFINEALDLIDCPPELRAHISGAVDEVFINIVNYAYASNEGMVTIGISVGEHVVICFEDSGKAFNPLEKPSPDLDKPLEERQHGGLGIFLVRQLMDKVNYSRIDDKNILIMAKKV